ncbi:MAG: 2Fe-2S iron-sulfur cluster-binding protein [Methyloligellaceae bacterium]
MNSTATVTRGGSVNTVKIGDNDTVLEAMIDANLNPPHSCMSGTCGTCKAKLVSGNVEMDSYLALTDEEMSSGYILCCQARPTTAEIAIGYEE